MTVRVSNPLPVFPDKQGFPLDGGDLYIGTNGADPEASPITVYVDSALTMPIPQPISVIGGLASYNGDPVPLYVSPDTYSMRARDIDGAEVFYAATSSFSAVAYQPLDSDLTAIAALTTAAFGRSLLTQADAAAARLALGISTANPTESLIIAVSDETTALTAGTGKVTFRMPYAFTLTAVRCSLTTAQATGSIFTVDINEGGASVLSTKLTIDNTEKTSTTAVGAAVISDSALADDAEITIDIDQVGDGTAKGLKVVLIGQRT